jgi:glycosyltransferase involved in cell wall biosynthesis
MRSVGLIFRRPRENFHSIEKVFSIVSSREIPGIEIKKYYLPYTTKGIMSIVRNLIYISKCKSDIIHITGDVHYAILAAFGKKSVLTVHDLVFLYHSKGLKRAILKWLFLDLPLKKASIVTTISEATKQDILRHKRIDPNKIIVIPNPLDTNLKFTTKDFNETNPRILFIGTGKNKNLERTIEALKGIPCHLRIIGKLNDDQQKLLDDSGINFSNAHNISDEEVSIEYQQSDIVLFPSTFEGFGLPILEGQQSGRVVITSDLEPMKSTCGDGALLVDPYSVKSIQKGVFDIIKNSGRREQLIENGFRNTGKYSVKEISLKYENVYRILM